MEYYLSCTPVEISVPSFTGLIPEMTYCEGDPTAILPTVDDNSIGGLWFPAVIDNMTSGVYVFTPDCHECADIFILNVNIIPKCDLVGIACDDSNAATFNDVYDDTCECIGTPVAQNFCTDNLLNVIGNPIADGIYDATQIVISSGVVANGSTVSHIAGDIVILNPGFTVEPNTYFVADIISCPMSLIQSDTSYIDKKQI